LHIQSSLFFDDESMRPALASRPLGLLAVPLSQILGHPIFLLSTFLLITDNGFVSLLIHVTSAQ
jgi:hypothetical protein